MRIEPKTMPPPRGGSQWFFSLLLKQRRWTCFTDRSAEIRYTIVVVWSSRVAAATMVVVV